MNWHKWGMGDWFCVAVSIAAILFFTIILSGCAHKKAGNLEIIWHNGKCLLVAQGLSIEEYKEETKNWDFKDCEVSVKADSK